MKLGMVHRWIGLGLSTALLVMSVTGSMLLWKREFLWLSLPDARDPLMHQPASVSHAINQLSQMYPPNEVRFIQLHSKNLSVHKIFLSGKRYAWHAQDGKQIQVWQGNQRYEDWLLDLHHRFLLGNSIGLNMAGFSAIILLPLMLLGFYLWWPRRKFLKLGITPRFASKQAWQISHGNLGVVAIIPILVIAATGVILVYPNEARTVLLDRFDEPTPSVVQITQLPAKVDLQAALEYAADYFPGSRPRWISLPSDGNSSLAIGVETVQDWNPTGQSSVAFQSDGTVRIKQAQQQPIGQRAFNFSYPLHAGEFGWFIRLCLTLIGCALAGLCLMGIGAFFKQPR